MNISIRNIALNTILVLLSTLFGILTINQFLIYISNNNNQRQEFPRTLLQYLDPVARWSYPDFKNSETNTNTLFIVGDSYAEGAGDLFLRNSYKYSIGHFLDKKWRKNTNIYLAANGGSNIPAQLYLLEKYLKGHTKNLTGLPIKSETLNLILYFYEGNDLENTFLNKKVPFQSFKSKLRLKFPIFYTVRNATYIAREKKLSFFNRQLPIIEQNNFRNNVCVENECRSMPRMQTASAVLSEEQITFEIEYLVNSIKKFSSKYTNTNMCLVYIPSPATIYSPKEDFFYQHYLPNKSLKTDAKSNNKKSLLIRRLLKDNLDFEFLTFVDPTKTLQKYARSEFIHGKLDPNHFNTYGYKLMANATSQGCQLNVEN